MCVNMRVIYFCMFSDEYEDKRDESRFSCRHFVNQSYFLIHTDTSHRYYCLIYVSY